MSDVLYKVRTVYETDTTKGTAGVGRMGGALGVLSGALDMARAGVRALFTGAAIVAGGGVMAGLAGLTYGVAHLNAQAEATGVGIAGMVQAAEVTNSSGGVATWAESMAFAEQTMVQIRRDAAALPGEADDFVEVFRAGLPAALEAGMRASDVSQFTNRFAAVGISFRVDSEQIGRDLNLMLQGRAGAHVNMWNRLKSTIGKTAEQFNALTAAQRQATIDTALRRYQGMIDAYGNTWEAVSSTTVSYFKDVLRFTSRPMFDALKGDMREMNEWWGAHERQVQEVANGVGHLLVGAYRRAGGAARDALTAFNQWSGSRQAANIMGMGGRVMGGAQALAGRAVGWVQEHPQEALSGAASAAGLATGIPGLGIVVGALANFATHTDAVTSVLDNLGWVGASVWGVLAELWPVVAAVESVLGDMLAAALPPLANALGVLMEAVLGVIQSLRPSVMALVEALRPVVVFLASALGGIAQMLAEFLAPVVRTLGDSISAVVHLVARIISWATERLGGVLGISGADFNTALRVTMRDMGAQMGVATSALLQGRLASDAELAAASARVNASEFEGGRGPRTDRVGPQGQGEQAQATALDRATAAINALRRPLEEQQRVELGATRGAARNAAHPGRPVVNVHIHQTINTTDDPDRLLLLTRRAVVQGIYAPVESPSVRVTR